MNNSFYYYVFDFDDTIIFSNLKIKIRDETTKEILNEFTPKQYSHYILNSNEIADFSDFDKDIPENLSRVDINSLFTINKPILRIMKDAVEQFGFDYVSVCTARINAKPVIRIIETLTELRGIKVAAVGSHDVKTNINVTNAQNKKQYIEDSIIIPFLTNNKNHNNDETSLCVCFYDDNDLNLQVVNELNSKYKKEIIRVRCIKTHRDGSVAFI